MEKKKRVAAGILSGLCMILLILDAKTAVTGAKTGVDLCVQTVIPSIFPFVFVSMIANNYISSIFVHIMHPVERLCAIPKGCESILVLGLLGGYPVGAQCISTAYQQNRICKANAARLLGFCNNAGPAFIFGMISSLFSSTTATWVIWFIHIIGAIVVGMLIPSTINTSHSTKPSDCIQQSNSMEKAIFVTAKICGWVIIFRVIISFVNRWLLWMLPIKYQIITLGFLELVNGCSALKEITLESERFILCSCFLAFGGVCVCMQTASVTKELPLSYYIRGKLMHSIICTSLAYFMHFILFTRDQWCIVPFFVPVFGIISVLMLSGRISIKKGIAIRGKMMYTS